MQNIVKLACLEVRIVSKIMHDSQIVLSKEAMEVWKNADMEKIQRKIHF